MADNPYDANSLQAAAYYGDLEAVHRFMEQGADVNAVNAECLGLTALAAAVQEGHDEIVRFLLDNGAGVDVEYQNGSTVLIGAAASSRHQIQKDWKPIVRMLIEAGADVNPINTNGMTPLNFAVGNIDVARLLISAGAHVNVADESHDWTALMYATLLDNLECVRLLIEAGADVNVVSVDGDTPWNLALREGYTEVAGLLKQAGAIEPPEVNLDLHKAILWGKTDAVVRLLEQGADANVKDRQQYSALSAAITHWNKVEIVRALLDHGADVNARDEWIEWIGTALMQAAERDNVEVVRLLLDYGADINAGDWEDKTALMNAAWVGNLEIASLLLDRGANVNAKMNNSQYSGGVDALIRAVEGEHIEIVRLLLDRGADVNTKDASDTTGLMHAYDNTGLVQLLLDRGAEINARDFYEQTALDKALERTHECENTEVIHILRQAGGEESPKKERWAYQAIPHDQSHLP